MCPFLSQINIYGSMLVNVETFPVGWMDGITILFIFSSVAYFFSVAFFHFPSANLTRYQRWWNSNTPTLWSGIGEKFHRLINKMRWWSRKTFHLAPEKMCVLHFCWQERWCGNIYDDKEMSKFRSRVIISRNLSSLVITLIAVIMNFLCL